MVAFFWAVPELHSTVRQMRIFSISVHVLGREMEDGEGKRCAALPKFASMLFEGMTTPPCAL